MCWNRQQWTRIGINIDAKSSWNIHAWMRKYIYHENFWVFGQPFAVVWVFSRNMHPNHILGENLFVTRSTKFFSPSITSTPSLSNYITAIDNNRHGNGANWYTACVHLQFILVWHLQKKKKKRDRKRKWPFGFKSKSLYSKEFAIECHALRILLLCYWVVWCGVVWCGLCLSLLESRLQCSCGVQFLVCLQSARNMQTVHSCTVRGSAYEHMHMGWVTQFISSIDKHLKPLTHRNYQLTKRNKISNDR